MSLNYVNFHILMSHPPSCLNRDDMNMQKTATFGGVRRTRISSQCLKRAIRTSDYYKTHFGAPSIRTKSLKALRDKAVAQLSDQYSAELISEAISRAAGKKEIDEKKDGSVAPWIIAEIEYLCKTLTEAKDSDLTDKELDKFMRERGGGLRKAGAGSLDVAFSGRMATSGLMNEFGQVDGALAVAHVLTTHAVESEVDWFTAVDDLQDLGSGHLDTQELSAGVFYRYASLNLSQLQSNLVDCDRNKALHHAAHLLHMLATVVPTAKSNSTAPFTFADFAMVSLSEMPLSMVNAFEMPVPNTRGGFMPPSIERLKNHHEHLEWSYEPNNRTADFQFGLKDESETHFGKLAHLEAWLRGDGVAAHA